MTSSVHRRNSSTVKNATYDKDISDFIKSLYDDDTNADERSLLKKNLVRCIEEELTPRQREVILLSYYQGLTVTKAAQFLGVGKATVSRTRRRAEANLKRMIRYGAKRLLYPEEG